MRLVILESPFAGETAEIRERNLDYARSALLDTLLRGESAMASHLLWPQVINDNIPLERAAGIAAGLAWAHHAHAVVVYEDYGISKGMSAALEIHERAGRKIEHRQLYGKV